MKVIIAIIVTVCVAAQGSWIPSGPVVSTDADLTNAIPTDVHPFVLRSGDDGPLIGYRHMAGATNDLDAPWVLPSRSGGRWMAVPPRAERVKVDGSTSGSATIYSGLASVIVSTGTLAGNLTYVLATNASASGGAPGHGRTVRVTRDKTAVDGGYSVTVVAGSTTNTLVSGGWFEYSWTGAAWVSIGSGDVQSVRVVEQDINSTAEPIEVGQAGITHYFFTGSATNTGPQTYHLPTNNVSSGAMLSITIVGTNSHPSQPILYDFVASGVTNRLYDSNRVDFVWTGSTWRRKPLLDQTFPFNGYLYAVRNGEAFELPVQSDAPADGNEYSRKNNGWVVTSGGGGSSTNHNALTGLQGGTTGEYYHLTSAQHTDLTDAGDSALHYHSSDRSRAVHTGTQLMSTISDWATNVWSKITSVFQRGNGVHFSTNEGANTLTISGWYLPGANITFTTNSDSSITVASTSGGGSTNGTPFAVNGGGILTLANLLDTVYAKWAAAGSNITLTITNLPQASVSSLVSDLAGKQEANTNLLQLATIAGSPGDVLYRAANGNWTNLGVGSTGQGLIVTNGAPRWMDLPAGGSTSSVGTVDRMWRTIAGVSFVSTNDGGGTYTELDGSSIVYSGVGSNLTISGSTDVDQAVYFNLEFSTPVSHTNYVVLADIESDRAINSGGIFVSAGVDTATGRTINGVTFAIVSTAGSANFSLGGRRIRVWVVDPNTLVSGEELTSIDASLLTGTIDTNRLPSGVATDSSAIPRLASSNAFTALQYFKEGLHVDPNKPVTIGGVTRTNWPTIGNTLSNATLLGTTTMDLLEVTTLEADDFSASNVTLTGNVTVPQPSSGASNSAPATTAWTQTTLAEALTGGSNFSAQVTIITNSGSGSYSVPSGASLLKVWGWAAGGGGGSGRKGATNSIQCGGGGGGSGAGGYIEIPVLALDGATTIVWTNGAGGVGGSSQTTNSSNGLAGTSGGMTSFGLWMVLSGGGGGAGGTTSSGTAGTAGDTFGVWTGRSGGSANAAGTSGGAGGDAYNTSPYLVNQRLASGGGAGGGITAAGVASTGGRGGIAASWLLTARGGNGYGSQGAINGNGGDGVSLHSAFAAPGAGGGGGGSSVTGNGGNGGRGALYGAGGGGGGAAGDGIGDSGAGGDGAVGVLMIIAE